MAAPKPVAQGELAKTPLLHALLTVHRRKMTGTLAIWPEAAEGDGQDRVLFKDGMIVGARLRESSSSLELSLIPIFHRKGGRYAFFETDLVGDAGVRGELDPLALGMASLRTGFREDAADKVLQRIKTGEWCLHPSAPVDRLAISAKEKPLIDLLKKGPCTLEQMLESGSGKMIRRTAYYLALLRLVVPADAKDSRASGRPKASRKSMRPGKSAAPGDPIPDTRSFQTLSRESVRPEANSRAARRPSRVPPPSQSSMRPVQGLAAPSVMPPAPVGGSLAREHRIRWAEIKEAHNAMDKMNYFQMLEVTQNASADDIRDSYYKLVKEWHVDRLPAELNDIRFWVDEIFQHLTAAYETLTDEKKRENYLRAVQDGGGTPAADRRLMRAFNASTEHQKAQILVRQGNFDKALAHLDEAILLAPEESEYRMLRAVALFRKDGVTESNRRELLKALDDCLKDNENNETALFAKGQILKQLGRTKEAVVLFKKVAASNERHLEAAREVRLAEMRNSQTPKGNGIFSKLFNKKGE